MTTLISCKTISPDFENKVFKNQYIMDQYMLMGKDSIYYYTSEYKFQGATPYYIKGNEIWEGQYYVSPRGSWLIENGKIVSVTQSNFEFKPLSKKEEAEFFRKIEENN